MVLHGPSIYMRIIDLCQLERFYCRLQRSFILRQKLKVITVCYLINNPFVCFMYLKQNVVLRLSVPSFKLNIVMRIVDCLVKVELALMAMLIPSI